MFEKLKVWWNTVVLPWLKKVGTKLWTWVKAHMMTIINYLIIFIVYNIVYGKMVGAEVLLGLWMFASVAYGAYHLFVKK